MTFALAKFKASCGITRSNGSQAMFLVVLASVWKQVSYNFLFFYAGLQAIPRSLIEAAAIDGAGPVRRFFGIALPLLSPTSFFLLVVNIIYAFFDTFPVIDAATGSGPAQSTQHAASTRSSPKVSRASTSAVPGRAIRGADGDRRRADGRAVPLHRTQGAILMIENRRGFDLFCHAVLIRRRRARRVSGVRRVLRGHDERESRCSACRLSLIRARICSRTSRPSGRTAAATRQRRSGACCANSLVMALVISIGKIAVSMISAYAIVFFRFPFKNLAFWLIFVTLMLPVEVRIFPTVASRLLDESRRAIRAV